MSYIIKLLIVYTAGALPILGSWLATKYTHDYPLILLIDIILFHWLIPKIFSSEKFGYTRHGGYYSGFNLSLDVYSLLTVFLYALGWAIFHFTDFTRYDSITLLLPRFEKNGFKIAYDIIIALFFTLFYVGSEHYYYKGFLEYNLYYTGKTDTTHKKEYETFRFLHCVYLSLMIGIKWFFIFQDSTGDAAIFWTIFWFVFHFFIDFSIEFRNYHYALALKQIFYIMYATTLLLYYFEISWIKKPESRQYYHPENYLIKLINKNSN